MALQYQKDIEHTELIQQKASKKTKVLKYMILKERLRELSYLNLKKRRWGRNLIALYIYLMER